MPILVTNAVQIARFANALYGIKLGSNTSAAVNEDVAALGLTATVNAYYNYSFGSKTSAEVADIILGNVGLAGNSAAAAFIVGQLNAAGVAKGAAVLGMLNAFSNLTSDATFGTAATAWNTTVASALVYTASNPEDVAATATTIQTYVLQGGVEVVTRTAGDDIIMAPHGSMQAFDVTDGGAGTDTLIIEGEDSGIGGAVSKGAFTNIEKVILNKFTDSGFEANASDFQGVQQIWVEDGGYKNGVGLDIANLTNAITVGLRGDTEAEIGLSYKSTATTSNITLDALSNSSGIRIDGKAINTVNLNGSVVTTGGLPIGTEGYTGVQIDHSETTKAITTLNVKTADTIAFDVSEIETVNKIDASTSTGNVFAIIELTDVGGNGAHNGVTYLGSAGNDYVEADLIDLDSKDVLKGNDGNDTLLLNIDYSDSAIDGGTWDEDYAPSAKEYALINKAEFEQVNFNGTGVSSGDWLILDASKLTASVIGTEEDTVVQNLENTDTVVFTNTVEHLGADIEIIDLLAKRDVINPTKYAAGAGTVNLSAATKGVTVEVSANLKQDGVLGSDDPEVGNFSDFSKLVVTGAGNVAMYNVHGYGVEIDASGLKGNLDVELAFDAVDKITLGAGKDEVDLFQLVGKLDLGSQPDLTTHDASDSDWFYDALSDYGNMDTITGFTSGQDKFVVNNITEGETIQLLNYTGDLGVDFSQTVSLALMAAKDAGADVASFVWTGNTYVVQDVFTPTVDWTGDFEQADDIVVKLTGVVSLVSTDFKAYVAPTTDV